MHAVYDILAVASDFILCDVQWSAVTRLFLMVIRVPSTIVDLKDRRREAMLVQRRSARNLLRPYLRRRTDSPP